MIKTKKTETFENFDDGVAIKTNEEIISEVLKDIEYIDHTIYNETEDKVITIQELLKNALLIKDEQTQEKVEALKELLRLACKPYVGEIGSKKLEYNQIVIRIDKIFKTSSGGKDES